MGGSETLTGQVIEVVAKVLGVSPDALSAESTMESVAKWDSMAVLRLAIACEETFRVQLSHGEIQRLVSIPEIVSILER